MNMVIKRLIIRELRTFFAIDDKYPDNFLFINLHYYFVQDENKTFEWVKVVEDLFDINIPASEIDLFFFQDFEIMIRVITENLKK